MQSKDDLILLESEGVIGKYLCTKDNSIIEAIGTIAVPRDDKIEMYRGTIIWSHNTPIIEQVWRMEKICRNFCVISSKEILSKARENITWSFGEFYYGDAVSIIKLAKEYDLNIEMVSVESGINLVI